MSITAEQQAQLRAAFPPEAIGKLPRITCRACSKKQCNEHVRKQCSGCRNYITERHIHLDYVGHAEVTDRLLSVDPTWTWEPMGFTPDGLPAIDRNGGLWIRLTACGVTRPGYGDAQGKEGGDAVKEAIGDAIRNAAMRFGVALDLWGAHGAGQDDGGDASAAQQRQARPAQQRNGQQRQQSRNGNGEVPKTADAARDVIRKDCERNGWSADLVADRYQSQHGMALRDETDVGKILAFRRGLFSVSDSTLREPAGNGATR